MDNNITLALAKAYVNQTLMGAGALKGEKGDKGDTGAPGTNGLDGINGTDGKDGLSIKAISITQDNKGKIIEAKATLSDDTFLDVDIITVDSGDSGDDSGDSGNETTEESGFDSVDF